LSDRTRGKQPVAPNLYQPLTFEPYQGPLILCVCEPPGPSARKVLWTLKEAGYRVRVQPLRADRITEHLLAGYRAAVLVMNPAEEAGYEICRAIRSLSALPILVVCEARPGDDVLRILETGADSYLVVPFSQSEFLARIYALIRPSLQDQLPV